MQAASAHARQSAYLPVSGGSRPPSLHALISSIAPDYFVSLRRGAQTDAITVVGVVVIRVAIVVHITEIRVVVGISRTQPPIRKGRRPK